MKILMACGGTGGHIFPAISVAEEIKQRRPDAEILYVCGKKDIESAIFKEVIHERWIPVAGAPLKKSLSLFNPLFLIKLLQGLIEARKILKRERPDLVVGFGGYFSFPVVCMARVLGRKTLIHEQNVVPGVANKFLARFVDGVALSFDETRPYLPKARNTRRTGNPIRSSIEKDCREEALGFFGFSKDRATLLVLGGSQGAESINTLFLGSLCFLPETARNQWQVLHLCGKMPADFVEREYLRAGISGKAYSFFQRMDLAYGVTDLALGRAGATFLAEVDAKKIPTILIPYPYGSGHQRANAKIFSQSGRAVVAEQSSLTPRSLADLLIRRMGSVRDGTGAREMAPLLPPNSRKLLTDFILEMVSAK